MLGTGGATGSPFGAQQPTQPFGTGITGTPFGAVQPQPQQQSAFRFPTFGATSTAASTFGAPTTTPATSFSFPVTSQPTFGTGFQQQQSAQPTMFGSGGAAQPTQMFGTTQPAPTFGTQPFGTQPQTSFRFPSFVPSATSAPPTFGSMTGTTNFSFPSTTGQFAGFQQQQQLQPQPQQHQIDPQHAFYQSIFQCNKFGDERDSILANFNYLQASLGTGKGYYSQTLPPVEYTPSNPFYRCKAVGYSFMYTNSNEDGLVSFEMKKSPEKVRAEETTLIAKLQSFLNKPNIIFKLAGVKGTSDEQSLVNVYAEDQTSLRRIPATDFAAAMSQPHLKPQLELLGISNVSAKIKPSPEQLKRYLANPPEGIDPRVWKQAQDDNPDPESMIPVPVVGVDALKKRIHAQETESEHHSARVAIIQEECGLYQNRCSNVGAEIVQLKRKQAQLSLRLLSIISRLEIARRGRSTLQPEELELRQRLENIEEDLNSPADYKGRLAELLSHLRLQQFNGPNAKYTIDETSLHEIKEFLTIQQKSLKHLVETVKDDLENLRMIVETTNDPKMTLDSYQKL